jgi:hypothetical protein
VPLYVRAGALIPHYRHAPQHLKGPAPKEWGIDIYPGDGHRHLVIGEPGYTVKIDYTNEGGTGKLEVSPAPVTLAVRLVDRRPTFLRAGEGTRLQPGDQTITFILDATPGASVTFKA